ncbi:helix-turn-helix transcriptional regulator [Bacillus horti]|uniref:Molybdopterin biosynthesis protein n=1 Tax=Caldalkalibacillus horti TaxID=77523 RepID=A0ABT9W4B3_9BACI|nr:helix-turn-helix transcriptional regulator [Bacillus horti]MDQ0167914.1 putative molybdopterin biosynthesis protein [Bacillus horti]
MKEKSYTIEEIAQLLKVSKLTVYDLIKKEKLIAYRVGRQMRVDESDLQAYKQGAKISKNEVQQGPIILRQQNPAIHGQQKPARDGQYTASPTRPVIISGQDVCLDILSKYMENEDQSFRPLRTYAGSLNSLVSMYQEECDVVSLHLYDAETDEYNLPYVKRLLTGHSYIVINLLYRWAGFFVQKGNPRKLKAWSDISQPGLRIVNREKGAGARVLLDEQCKLHHIKATELQGYTIEETSHLGVAGAVAASRADLGIGSEKAARMVGVDFIPLIKERYDLVIKKNAKNEQLIKLILSILQSDSFRKELDSLGGYDLSDVGKIMYETD